MAGEDAHVRGPKQVLGENRRWEGRLARAMGMLTRKGAHQVQHDR